MTASSAETTGSKQEALANAMRLLQGHPAAAAEQARFVIEGDAECADAHLILSHAMNRLGDANQARSAEREAIELFSLDPSLLEAAMALADSRVDVAEKLVRPRLESNPNDPVALYLLADIGIRMQKFDLAEEFLARSLSLAPNYEWAQDTRKALKRLKRHLPRATSSARPTIAMQASENGSSLARSYEKALDLYEIAVRRRPDRPDYWVSYGHVLRAVGRRDDAIVSYRRAIATKPTVGDAWWALADLKSSAFADGDVEQMVRLLKTPTLEEDDRIKLEFALARAYEQHADLNNARRHYEVGNRAKAAALGYDRSVVTRHVDKSIATFTKAFFEVGANAGFEAQDPIFIVGAPRAGSTVIEQILGSHPQIEATMELPDIHGLAVHLSKDPAAFEGGAYLDALSSLPPNELRRLGQSYIWSSGLRRIIDRPFFLDKMPNNWLHVGLILSILPNAKIIDARRHPLDCGVSNFRQLYGQSQGFSYDLTDFGAYYTDYTRLMAHFGSILPGRIHRVIHEELVESPEPIIRKMLDYLGVPFDGACLHPHESTRVVRTASSEQVRRPINREGIGQWKRYELWAAELKAALGPVLDAYPAVPADVRAP
jgi:tetratricopeptide (TPR) repeat protein